MRKMTLNLTGHEIPVTELAIVERRERGLAVECTLEDGSILRFMAVPLEVHRLDGQFNDDGSPAYVVTLQLVQLTESLSEVPQ